MSHNDRSGQSAGDHGKKPAAPVTATKVPESKAPADKKVVPDAVKKDGNKKK